MLFPAQDSNLHVSALVSVFAVPFVFEARSSTDLPRYISYECPRIRDYLGPLASFWTAHRDHTLEDVMSAFKKGFELLRSVPILTLAGPPFQQSFSFVSPAGIKRAFTALLLTHHSFSGIFRLAPGSDVYISVVVTNGPPLLQISYYVRVLFLHSVCNPPNPHVQT